MKCANLPDNILNEFIHGEGNVGMDGKHLPKGVLILGWLHVPIQEIPHHFQKHGVIVLHLDVHCREKEENRFFCKNRKIYKYEIKKPIRQL